ncbi:MAG: ABC transporter ATP-binding protein [Anaerolineaceae bacterium]
MNDYAIQTRGLTRDFSTVRAVDHLELDIPHGIVFGFLGPNGAGKTTTIHLLLGLLEATDGSAQVLGVDVRSQADRVREQSGALLEHTGLYERLSAQDNLEYFGRIARMSAGDRSARIRELLQKLDLWDRREESVGKWSRGMKQKLAVARALMHHPKLLFLDEPTSGLDPISAAALRDDLMAVASHEGVTVFLTTHNLVEAEKLCAQVAVIREGKLLRVGSPDTLRTQEAAPRMEVVGAGFSETLLAALRARPEVLSVEQMNNHLIVETHPGADTAPLVSLMVSDGASIEEVRKGKASLEDVFLTLMEEEK